MKKGKKDRIETPEERFIRVMCGDAFVERIRKDAEESVRRGKRRKK